LIDLHTHTCESDGTLTPEQLIRAAVELGLEALGICDHDTFAGYNQAVPLAQAAGLELVCGIELSTKLRRKPQSRGKSVHVLGYFLEGPPASEFRTWLEQLQRSRRDRNVRMTARLAELGLEVKLEEVEALGRSLAGRPHFARILLRKGYVSNLQEAFDLYLGESGKAYVEREEPGLAEGIRRVLEAGGLPSLAHPLRLGKHTREAMDKLVAEMRDMGLKGIEVYHSDHGPGEVDQFLSVARHCGLAVTGGTDFHGENKPNIALGTGANGNLTIPRSVLDELLAARAWRELRPQAGQMTHRRDAEEAERNSASSAPLR
jgi:predicted metal-dependent phosphoesterase TrpH